jgi:phage-related protein
MAYLLQFNGYTLPSTLMPNGGQRQSDLGDQELPRADGASVQPARRRSRPLSVQGSITAATADALESILDDLESACQTPDGPAQLFFGRDDRYYLAQVQQYSAAYSEGLTWGLFATVQIGFFAQQPDAYGITPVTASVSTSASSLTPLGDAPTLPAWTITIGSAGTGPITLTNSTTLETCTLTPVSGSFGAGDVLALARDGYTVTQNGAAAFGLLGGRMPRLMPGANSLSLTAGGTATISSASVTYTPRWA